MLAYQPIGFIRRSIVNLVLLGSGEDLELVTDNQMFTGTFWVNEY